MLTLLLRLALKLLPCFLADVKIMIFLCAHTYIPVRPHIHSSQLDPKQEEVAVCLLIHPQAKLRATKAQTKKTKFTIRSKVIPICCICCKAGQRTAFFQCATRNVTGVYNGDHTYAQEGCSKGQDGVLNMPLGVSSSSSSSLSSSSSCLELFNIRSMPPLGLRTFCPSQCIPLWMISAASRKGCSIRPPKCTAAHTIPFACWDRDPPNQFDTRTPQDWIHL